MGSRKLWNVVGVSLIVVFSMICIGGLLGVKIPADPLFKDVREMQVGERGYVKQQSIHIVYERCYNELYYVDGVDIVALLPKPYKKYEVLIERTEEGFKIVSGYDSGQSIVNLYEISPDTMIPIFLK